MVHLVRIRAITVSVIHILSWAHLGAEAGAALPTLQHCKKKEKKKSEILHKRLSAGTFSVSICPLRCHPPAALISAKGLPQLTEDSQPEP